MNDRIRELAHEAGLPTYNPTGIPTKLEKFAELIIKNCATIADFAHLGGIIEPGVMIKEYFGIDR